MRLLLRSLFVQVELANERESGDLFFTFDGMAVSSRSDQARKTWPPSRSVRASAVHSF